MRFFFSYVAFALLLYFDSKAQPAPAFEEAVAKQLPVLLVFSGSDWCQLCIKFDKQILQDSIFKAFADNRLLVLKADFPQRKKLSKEIITTNELLAERYNPNGSFPLAVLLNSDGSHIARLETSTSTAVFIEQLNSAFKKGNYLREFHATERIMATPFDFTIVDTSNEHGWQLIREGIAEVKRIEGFLSQYNDSTEVSRMLSTAGVSACKVSSELFQLTKRCLEISKLTQGAFDITFASAGKLWKFDGSMKKVPDSSKVKEAVKSVGYQKVVLLTGDSIFLADKNVRLGYDACGNGYGADKAKDLLVKRGVKSGVINGSGDLIAWGKQPNGKPWKVGIADPFERGKIILWLPVEDKAVATSGNYEKYVDLGGVRYTHIIDPRNGWPVKGLRSVTIISPSAELSDALATAVFVMGKEAGMSLIDQLPKTNCIIIDEQKNIFYSKNLKLNPPDEKPEKN